MRKLTPEERLIAVTCIVFPVFFVWLNAMLTVYERTGGAW